MHACQRVDALPWADECAPAHSILGDDMPIRADNEDGSQHKLNAAQVLAAGLLGIALGCGLCTDVF